MSLTFSYMDDRNTSTLFDWHWQFIKKKRKEKKDDYYGLDQNFIFYSIKLGYIF